VERSVTRLVAVAVAACCLVVPAACSSGSAHRSSAAQARPLSAEAARALVEDGERRLAAAYAAGDTSRLEEFLAGPQLQGNSATIDILNGRHQHNVFHVVVDNVAVQSATGDRMVLGVQDHTTDNAFVDTTTGQPLNGGLPGPEAQSFVLFFDRNPHDGRWYWTGAQKQ
jgi:hypothetical protein